MEPQKGDTGKFSVAGQSINNFQGAEVSSWPYGVLPGAHRSATSMPLPLEYSIWVSATGGNNEEVSDGDQWKYDHVFFCANTSMKKMTVFFWTLEGIQKT